MPVTIEDIERLREKLAALPQHRPRKVSKHEAVALLTGELAGAQRRGYGVDDLAQLFSESGITINAATLRGYLRQTRKKRKRPPGKSSGTAAANPPSASQQSQVIPRLPPPVPSERPSLPTRVAPASADDASGTNAKASPERR